MKTLSVPAVGMVCALFAPQSHALIVGKIEVRLAVAAGCEITGGQGASASGQIHNFGRLDFGNAGPTWHNALTARLTDTGGNIVVECSPDIAGFNVVIDGGLRGDRTLAHETSSSLIAYEVFRDAARSNEYVSSVPQPFVVDGHPVEVPVFGAIAPNGSAKSSGLYIDTLLVTIDF